jgi:hypothetical protein
MSTGVPCSTPRISSGARYSRAMMYAAQHTRIERGRKHTHGQCTQAVSGSSSND